ncbi:MAG: hypothetical protein Q9187_006702 [Circinaria calcarea]
MEGIAAASSIVAILTLVGHSIQGLVKLQDFFEDVSSASRTIERFLFDLNSLLHILHEVENLFVTISTFKMPDGLDTNIALLQGQLDNTNKDISKWLQKVRSLRPASDKGQVAWLKKSLVAFSKGSIKGIREEIRGDKQSIEVNLTILGRKMDLHMTSSIKRLNDKVDRLNSISLSAANDITSRVESYSQAHMESSASSVRSLDSIASSLSRLESFVGAVSNPTASRRGSLTRLPSGSSLQKKSNFYDMLPIEDHPVRTTIGSPRSDLEGFESYDFPSRRFWSCDILYEHHEAAFHPSTSNPSNGNLTISETDTCCLCGEEFPNEPAPDWDNRLAHLRSVHAIGVCSNPNKKFSRVDHFRLHIKHRHAGRSGKWTRKLEMASMQDEIQDSMDAASEDEAILTPQRVMPVDHDHVLRELTKEIYPAVVVDYISTRRLMILFDGQLALFKASVGLSQPRGANDLDSTGAFSISGQHLPRQKALEDTLMQLRHDLRDARSRCLQAGHSLYEIDQALHHTSHNDSTSAEPSLINHSDMFEIRRKTMDSPLIGKWTTTRDRINRWLLHSLRSDDSLAKLHRSMLADEDLNEKAWAKLVVKYWELDEAAIGSELATSLSVGATHSHRNSYHEWDDFHTCRGS